MPKRQQSGDSLPGKPSSSRKVVEQTPSTNTNKNNCFRKMTSTKYIRLAVTVLLILVGVSFLEIDKSTIRTFKAFAMEASDTKARTASGEYVHYDLQKKPKPGLAAQVAARANLKPSIKTQDQKNGIVAKMKQVVNQKKKLREGSRRDRKEQEETLEDTATQQESTTTTTTAVSEELKQVQDLVHENQQEMEEWKALAKEKDQKIDKLTGVVEKLLAAMETQPNTTTSRTTSTLASSTTTTATSSSVEQENADALKFHQQQLEKMPDATKEEIKQWKRKRRQEYKQQQQQQQGETPKAAQPNLRTPQTKPPKKKRRPPVTHDEMIQYEYEKRSHEQRRSLINMDTAIVWATRDFQPFKDMLGDGLDYVNEHLLGKNGTRNIWNDTTRDLVLDERLCVAARHFKEAGSVKHHVLIMHLNENWGGLSSEVIGRTNTWGSMNATMGKCSQEAVDEYLNDEHTHAVITTQFQDMDHPKVHSIPLGVKDYSVQHLLDRINQTEPPERDQLVFMSFNPSEDRNPQIEAIERNFNGTKNEVHNRYGDRGYDLYYDNLVRSKFVISPSGMGWDCYRNWEAFSFGAIPIIEIYNRTYDGWRSRTLKDLPVLLVNTFDEVTPELLESEYTRIAARSETYNYEKLTKKWWLDFINSFRSPEQRERGFWKKGEEEDSQEEEESQEEEDSNDESS